jgi:hypothetical protein
LPPRSNICKCVTPQIPIEVMPVCMTNDEKCSPLTMI